jgi:glycerophosphoryl diester phosphodiesterase
MMNSPSSQYGKIVLVIIVAIFSTSIFLTERNYRANVTMETNNQKKNVEITNIAHRGARSLAPENTLLAASKAYEAGADMWETDVQFTKDRRLVLMHDDTLLRTTDVESVYPGRDSYAVSNFTLDEINRLDAGGWFVDIDPFEQISGGKIPQQEMDRFKGVKVPALREGLKLTKRLEWKINLEIKPVKKTTNLIAKKVVRLVEEMDMEDVVVISSFDHSLVKSVSELNPGISTALLVEEPEPDILEAMRETGARALNVAASALEKYRVIATLRELKATREDYRVNVFTVNKEEHLKQLVKNSLVDGIFTDFPHRLSSILKH